MASPSRPAARTAWLDVGRGLAITLVVLLHTTEWLATAGRPSAAWTTFHVFATGVRMPLFFAISGLLAARRVQESWRDLLTGRVLLLTWVYLVWEAVGSASALAAAQITGDHLYPLRMLESYLAVVVRPRFELWFLWVLVMALLLARATRRVPVPVQLGVAGVASAVFFSDLVPQLNQGWDGLVRFYVFFLIGLHLRGRLLALGETMRPARAFGLVAVWAGLAAGVQWQGWDGAPGVGLLVRLAGLVAGVALATQLTGVRPLRYLGSRTLPVYLAHTPVIVLVVWGLTVWDTSRADGWAYTPPVAAFAVLVSLGLHRLTRVSPAGWLYRPPAGLTARLRSLRRRVPAPVDGAQTDRAARTAA
ncbi:acyltransferase family protein [Spongisporangium articulatum]|uniref:Acyltransferase family protein n=1 Tax=Spongisporangium articulatum TaxID=3362603 RepID=A0ABW8AHD8_9ACTN